MSEHIQIAERRIKEALKDIENLHVLNARLKLNQALLELKKQPELFSPGEITFLISCMGTEEGRLQGWPGYDNLLEKLSLMR